MARKKERERERRGEEENVERGKMSRVGERQVDSERTR